MTQTVTGLFDSYDDAAAAVRKLEASGIPHSDISLVANNVEQRYGREPAHTAADTATDAGAGAGIGAALGGVGGLLAGLGMIAIPGVGPVVAAGWLVAAAAGAVAGAAAGGAAGGIVGALTNSGVPETDAHVYAEAVRRGSMLVSARVADSRAADANAILQGFRPVDVAARGAAFRNSGWSRFDEKADAYTAEQVRNERARY